MFFCNNALSKGWNGIYIQLNRNFLNEFWQEAEKTLGYRFIFCVSLHSLNGFLKTLHQSLNALCQADLDLKWTHIVNQYYENQCFVLKTLTNKNIKLKPIC